MTGTRTSIARFLLVVPLVVAGLTLTSVPASAVGSWRGVARMLVPRSGHTMTVLENGRVLVTGGNVSNVDFLPTTSVEIYTPSTNTWRLVTPMHSAKAFHSAVLLESGRVFVFGQGGGEIYTPWTDRWRRTAPTLQDRDDSGSAATLLDTGEVLLVGGAENPDVEAVAEIYTPRTDTWRETAPNPFFGSCCGASLVTLPSGRALLFGGYVSQGFPGSPAEYRPKRDEWVASANGPGLTEMNDVVVLASGRALLAGGRALCCSPTPDQNDAWLYDARAHRWTPTGSMHLARYLHVTVALANGGALVAAGYPNIQDPFTERPRSAEVYDPVSATWRWAGPTVVAHRAGAAAALLQDGRVLLTGGQGVPRVPGGPPLRAAEVYVPAP